MSRVDPDDALDDVRRLRRLGVRALVVAVVAVVAHFASERVTVSPSSSAFTHACARARGRRRAQEDACVVSDVSVDLVVAGVFDGHDGSTASARAARETTRAAKRADAGGAASVVRALGDACDGEASGTTVVLALVRSDGFEVAHVGDSAAYACETSGGGVRARRLTEDHGLGNARERARVRAEGGTIVESRGAMRVGGEYLVTRALGGTARRARGVSQTPDVVARRWRTNELGLILTSDGTTERLKPDDACAFVFTGKRKCDESAQVDTAIALDGDAASSTQSSEDALDTVEVQGNSEVMNERVERALKCALELGSSDNVALAAVSAGRHNTQITVTQQKPSSLVAEMLSIGSNIEEYKITQLVAWSSGPYLPAKTPFRYDDMYDEEPQPTYNFGRKFEQSAIEGALTALALAPGKGEKNRVQNAITSYVGIIDSRLARGQDEGVRAGERPFARGHFG